MWLPFRECCGLDQRVFPLEQKAGARGLQLLLIPQTPQLVASALSRLRIHALVSPTSVMGPGDTCLLCVELFVLLAASP